MSISTTFALFAVTGALLTTTAPSAAQRNFYRLFAVVSMLLAVLVLLA